MNLIVDWWGSSRSLEKYCGPRETVCWFSLIWKNAVVELVGKGLGRSFTLTPLYRSWVRKLRVPLLCWRLSVG
jgi:hypothetical protein